MNLQRPRIQNIFSALAAGILGSALVGCTGDRYTMRVEKESLSETVEGSRWQIVKVAAVIGGDTIPAQVCDETILVHIDGNNVVKEASALSPKSCMGEASLKNTIVGAVIPTAVLAAGQVWAAHELRPTRITTSETTNVSGVSSSDSASQSESSADADQRQDQAQTQGQEQVQDQDQNAFGGDARADNASSIVQQPNVNQNPAVNQSTEVKNINMRIGPVRPPKQPKPSKRGKGKDHGKSGKGKDPHGWKNGWMN